MRRDDDHEICLRIDLLLKEAIQGSCDTVRRLSSCSRPAMEKLCPSRSSTVVRASAGEKLVEVGTSAVFEKSDKGHPRKQVRVSTPFLLTQNN
jgi:hypothetical protein